MTDREHIRYEHYEVYVREDGSPWELGRGAMGATYKAFDTSLHTDVALKVISEKCFANPTARKRFEREARAAAKLRHPNIASVYHFGTGETDSFYAMELVDGETVEHLLRKRGRIDTETALEIVIQVSRALVAAEKRHIVHRDLKPANIMLHEEDGELLVKVIDFGLAKQLDNPRDAGVTVQGFVGTPHFASPEQLNERPLDTRSDIYSLGATLWHMLTGRPPFTGSVVQIVSQHLSAPLPMKAVESQPTPVKQLLTAMLAKDAADRPQTATALRRRAQQALAAIRSGNGVDATGFAGAGDLETDQETLEPAETAASLAPTVGQVRSVQRSELSIAPRPKPSSAPPVRAPTRPKRLWLPITAGVAGAIVLAASAWLFVHRSPEVPETSEPHAIPEEPDAELLAEKVDSAWSEGRNADAISMLAISSDTIPNAQERLETMVRKSTSSLKGAPPPELRAALIDAAEVGSPTAMYVLANAIVEEYPSRAALWYEKAASRGNAKAMTRLGLLNAKGIDHLPPNAEHAIPWFEKASEAGDPEGQFALAECLLRGLGSLKRDPARAVALLKRAAEQDYPRALDLLGTVYSQGKVVPKDYHASYEYYQRAAKLNYAPSMANLGVLLMNGHGPSGQPDPAGAVHLFERGANAGDPISMLYLAMALEGGAGLPPNPKKARTWYVAAAKAGNKRALEWCRNQKIEGF